MAELSEPEGRMAPHNAMPVKGFTTLNKESAAGSCRNIQQAGTRPAVGLPYLTASKPGWPTVFPCLMCILHSQRFCQMKINAVIKTLKPLLRQAEPAIDSEQYPVCGRLHQSLSAPLSHQDQYIPHCHDRRSRRCFREFLPEDLAGAGCA